MSVSRSYSATVILAVVTVLFGLGFGAAARELVPDAPPAIYPIVIERSRAVVDSRTTNTATSTTAALAATVVAETTVTVGNEFSITARVVSRPPQVAVPTAGPPVPTSLDDDHDHEGDDDDG
jgi:hypothetical protein